VTSDWLPAMEVVPACDVCGSSASTPLVDARDRQHFVPGRFALVACDACGTGRLSPRPVLSDLGRYYPASEYYAHQPAALTFGSGERGLAAVRDQLRNDAVRGLGYPAPRGPLLSRGAARLLGRPLRRRLAYGAPGFPRWVPDGRALDVGCGNGFFLALLRHHGWRVEGVDASPDAAVTAERSFGIPVHVGELHDEAVEGPFDFVHLSHVIEHVASPTDLLHRVRELLRPGATAYIETPNLASFGFRVWREQWFPIEAPRHLWLFTGSSLGRAAAAAGLRVDRLQTHRYADFAWEATYRFEDRTGQLRDPRPSVAHAELPRVLALRARSLVRHAIDRSSGEIIRCWVSRP